MIYAPAVNDRIESIDMETYDIRIDRFDKIDLAALVELATTYYPVGHDARNPQYLQWMFLRNPMGVGRVVIATTATSHVGMIGLAPICIRKGAQAIRANIAMNVLVHPEHRSANLFVKMIRVAQAELASTDEWLIGHPNANAYPGWRRRKMAFRAGMKACIAFPTLGISRRRFTTVGKGEDSLLDKLDFSPLRTWREELNHPVIDADADFLRWRFLRHPSRKYSILLQIDRGHVLGYCVERHLRRGIANVAVDWQGEHFWRNGPPGDFWRITVVPWPVGTAGMPPLPKSVFRVPGIGKTYRFFATPCGASEAGEESWAHVTLAATDFG